MASEKKPRKTTKKKAPVTGGTTPKEPNAGAGEMLGWEDDPFPPANPINRPVPQMESPPLALAITGPAPTAKAYQPGSQEFRYWTAAEALRRAAEFWSKLVPASTTWQPGPTLRIWLDQGEDLNAYYDRRGLSFFHATVGGQTIYSGESPDVVCHELGHAVLDALRPQLWDAGSVEADAFHESFGDISAILSALQLPSVRVSVLAETGGRLYRSSRLSRIAEQLGWGIRQIRPDRAEPDCLRNAVNSFFYREPRTLPPIGPAWTLSTEPHSFSRVFTGGFFAALAGMLAVQSSSPTESQLLQVSHEAGQLLVDAVLGAPLVPDYFSQVAAHMIEAGELRYNGMYRDVLRSAFVQHGVLSLESATATRPQAAVTPRRSMIGMENAAVERDSGMENVAGRSTELPRVTFSATQYGLGTQRLLVHACGELKRFSVASAALDLGSVEPPNYAQAAQIFVEDLFRRGRVDIGGHGDPDANTTYPTVRLKTHELVEEAAGLLLVRRIFDCGFDCG